MPAGTIKHWFRPAFLNIERPRLYQGLMIIILQEFLNVGYLIQNFFRPAGYKKYAPGPYNPAGICG